MLHPLLQDLQKIRQAYFDSKDKNIQEIWASAKCKWFLPKYRKRRIEKILWKNYLICKDIVITAYRLSYEGGYNGVL